MPHRFRSAAIQFAAEMYDRLRGTRRPIHPIDRALGIETSQRVRRAALDSGDPNDALSVGYVGATPSIIRKCLDLIGVGAGDVFVDLGCGKGRALIVAAEYPFRALVGIELSDYLCAIARRNIARLRPRARYADRISVLRGDASQPDLPDAPSVVLFVYNPFHRPLVVALRAHLESEAARAPDRKVWLVYYNPVCFDLFDESPAFQRFFAARIDFEDEERAAAPTGNTFDSVIIYQSVSNPHRPALPGADARVRITIPDKGADVIGAD